MKVGERRTERARRGGRKATAGITARSLCCSVPWIENGLEGQKNEGRTASTCTPARPGCSLPPSLPRSHGMQADRLQLCQKSSLICAHDETPFQVEALSVVCVLVVV